MRSGRRLPASWTVALGFCSVWGGFSTTVWSQDLARAEPPTPAAPGTSTSVEQLAERLQAMEEMNRQLVKQLELSSKNHDDQIKRLVQGYEELSNQFNEQKATGEVARTALPRASDSPGNPMSPIPGYRDGVTISNPPVPSSEPSKTPTLGRLPLKADFGPGFRWQTDDDEYQLQVRLESQIDARIWAQRDQLPANSGIYLPRQRIFFSGRITKPVEYELSINRGLGNINLLNAYLNYHFDDRLEFRLGRFFTPLDYEQYAIANYWLPTPERSIFTTNVGLNRKFGMMAWGYLFDKRLDYAAGVFNGGRNSFEPLSKGQDFVGYLNARPFQNSTSLPFAKYLNIGSSVAFGNQDQSPVPVAFRIAAASPNADNPGAGVVPFLTLNRDVVERGNRLIGSVHAAYYYKSLSLISEWQYGFGSYASATQHLPVQVPLGGYYATAGYFLTGEQVERRTVVRPLRPFVPLNKTEKRGPGAWEAVARVSELRLGNQIFSSGFADRTLWSNSAMTTEVGLNWYWNDYMKVYMFWLHGEFGDPVQYRPGAYQKTADMFWMRFQLYF